MLLFAKDIVDTNFVENMHADDTGFVSAIARFKTLGGAHEARDRLNGKPNAANDANMIVELLQNGLPGGRRNTVDATASTRHNSNSTSSVISSNGARQPSRFTNTFLEKMSPPNVTSGLNGDSFPAPDTNGRLENLFSPQSPLSHSFQSSKSMIADDPGDDETGQIIQDPLAYAKSGQATMSRRQTNPSIPVRGMAGLSLSTPPPIPNYTSPRSLVSMPTPASAMSPPSSAMSPNGISPMTTMGPNGNFNFMPYHNRPNLPPVNPADQNPPCNTLYVGNLPIDTSEDELKAMFSKQRGYKRLCFRTKQNGPMCFVEFEDVSFATKALHELYGQPLHNSVKGGIRLSFSKNPLGVRNNQTNGMMPPTPMTPQSVGIPNGLGNSSAFTTATGPPPGLAPPGLGMSGGGGGGGGGGGSGSAFGMYGNGAFSMAGNNMRAPPVGASGNAYSGVDGAFGNGYMMR